MANMKLLLLFAVYFAFSNGTPSFIPEFDKPVHKGLRAIQEKDFTVLPKMNWRYFQHLPVIYNWLDNLAGDNPNFIKRQWIGRTYEGRRIAAVTVSAKPNRKAIFIESNIYGNQWMTSAATTCFMQNLTHSDDEEMKSLLENYDWIFVPVLNPDGFVYSQNEDSLWLKNRSPNSGPPWCKGTNLDGNFDYRWNESEFKNDNPYDQFYSGPKGDSEEEVRALKMFIQSFPKGYIRMYLAVHSLRFGTAPPDEESNLFAHKEADQNNFLRDLSYDYLGSSTAWARHGNSIPFVSGLSIRDYCLSLGGLQSGEILSVCDEATRDIKALVKKAQAEGAFD